MGIGSSDFAKHSDKFLGNYRAKVEAVNDPLQLGRIRVRAYPMFVDIMPITLLPWAVPAMPVFDGSGSGTGNFCVPKVGSFVWVFFEAGDIYQPVYFAEALDAVHGLPSFRTTNYPNRKCWKSAGISMYVDDTLNEVKVFHPTGTYLKIDAVGKVLVRGVSNFSMLADGDITLIGATINLNPISYSDTFDATTGIDAGASVGEEYV